MAIKKGDAVKDWQKSLSEAGYDPGPQDGVWGAKTSAATKKFQADSSLTPDGKVTDEVQEAMRKHLAGETKTDDKVPAPFYKKPLFWVALSGAAFVAFTAWRDKE